MDETRTLEQIVKSLMKHSWRMDLGAGPKVVYPDEIILDLFGKDAMEKNFIECSEKKATEKKKEYVIICTDQLSSNNSFLFWKPQGKGYTADLNEAGIWNEKPSRSQDVVIEKDVLLQKFKSHYIVGESMLQLMALKDEELVKK
jgi:hypothetical protein